MSIGAGMFIPTLVRWYWWRMNGWGFAIGTAVGMIAAVLQRITFPDIPEYYSFIFASGTSLLALIIATLVTAPTEDKVLFEFYKITRPFGFWSKIRKRIPKAVLMQVNKENKRDKISIFIAVPWQLVLFMLWITVIMKRFDLSGILFGVLIVLSIGLYFFWFRHLSTTVVMGNEDKPV